MALSVRAISKAMCTSILVALVTPVQADVFLKAHETAGEHSLRKDLVKQALLSDLADAARIRSLEEELRPLHAAMPKNERGMLEPAVVRYALHRYFAQKHGWHLKGLERGQSGWNASSPTILKDQAPSYIQSVFEERMHGEGLGLHELAAFAATLSDLIRQQVAGEIEYIYDVLSASTSSLTDLRYFDDLILKTYMVAYSYGLEEGGSNTPEAFVEHETWLEEYMISWPDIKLWVRDLRQTFDLTQSSRRNPFEIGVSFERAVDIAEEISHRFGSFHMMECRAAKDKLVDLEYEGTGRVPLSSFYGGASADEDWPFHESPEYLRNLGVLDESSPGRPSVVIPNYIGSISNCPTPSDFYMVCCRDECEGLMAHIEARIGGPLAPPAVIADVVSGLASDTVEAPRNLSSVQLRRLQEIAEHHDGHVPVHGRLFAQWMHHAYPRECHFPHLAGATNPLSHEDWLEETGRESISISDEVLSHYRLSGKVALDIEADLLPWIAGEELVASHTLTAGREPQTASQFLRLAALLAAVVSAGFSVSRASGPVGLCASESKEDRHLV